MAARQKTWKGKALKAGADTRVSLVKQKLDRMQSFCNNGNFFMRFALTLVAASTILVACGGGSGDDNDSPNPGPGAGSGPSAAMSATITPTNYVAVAQEALSSNALLLNSSSLVLGAQVSDSSALVRFGQEQLSKLPRRIANAPVQAVGATLTETEPCVGGGTLTYVENDLNGNEEPDAGDSVLVTANNCSENGVVLNGKLNLTLSRVTGDVDGYPYTLAGTLSFENLAAQSIQSPQDRDVANGSMTMNVNARGDFDQTIQMGIASFAISSTYGGAASSKTLTNYDKSLQVSPSGSDFNLASSDNGTMTSSAFDSKSVFIETPVPFVSSASQPYPASGQAIITGAAGAKVRVTATSASTVTIDLDADGNGSYETTVSKPWSEIL